MVDFARERPINVKRLAKTLDVSKDTIRKWREEGLETAKRGATVLTTWEAVNRFFHSPESIDADAELAEQMAIAARR